MNREKVRYYFIRIKDFFINWTRNWWKISGNGAECFDCCDKCLQMCPECNECHSEDVNEPYTHTGMYCPHRGYTYPGDLPEELKREMKDVENRLKVFFGVE